MTDKQRPPFNELVENATQVFGKELMKEVPELAGIGFFMLYRASLGEPMPQYVLVGDVDNNLFMLTAAAQAAKLARDAAGTAALRLDRAATDTRNEVNALKQDEEDHTQGSGDQEAEDRRDLDADGAAQSSEDPDVGRTPGG